MRSLQGQPRGSERDEFEDSSLHRMLCDACGRVLAVGRLQALDMHTAQIRYMAVASEYQRRGLGSRILRELEQAALDAGHTRILLHARAAALPFYQRRGYQLLSPSHLLFGEIQHYRMTKELSPEAGGA